MVAKFVGVDESQGCCEDKHRMIVKNTRKAEYEGLFTLLRSKHSRAGTAAKSQVEGTASRIRHALLDEVFQGLVLICLA